MIVDFDAPILDFKGNPMKAEAGSEDPATLEVVAISALMAQIDERAPSGKEKFERFQLAVKCKGKVNLKAEEVSMLKDQIGKFGSPLVVGRAWQLLDSAEGEPVAGD